MPKAAFIDRDGVINREVEYLHRIEDFEFIDGVFDACRLLADNGYRLVVVTNQSGIGRGYYDEAQYLALTRWMVARFADRGIVIDGVYHCPHHPRHGIGEYRMACECRKPKPGMLLQAAREHDIVLSRSLMFGDKEADVEAGRAAGVGATVLVRSGHPVDEHSTRADHVIDSLGDCQALRKIILEQEAEKWLNRV